jgi:hypothetical protein
MDIEGRVAHGAAVRIGRQGLSKGTVPGVIAPAVRLGSRESGDAEWRYNTIDALVVHLAGH